MCRVMGSHTSSRSLLPLVQVQVTHPLLISNSACVNFPQLGMPYHTVLVSLKHCSDAHRLTAFLRWSVC